MGFAAGPQNTARSEVFPLIRELMMAGGETLVVASIVFLPFDCLHLLSSVKYAGWCLGDPENLMCCAFFGCKSRSQTNPRADGVVFCRGSPFLVAGFVFFAYRHVCFCCVCRSLGVGPRQCFICVCRRYFIYLFFMR